MCHIYSNNVTFFFRAVCGCWTEFGIHPHKGHAIPRFTNFRAAAVRKLACCRVWGFSKFNVSLISVQAQPRHLQFSQRSWLGPVGKLCQLGQAQDIPNLLSLRVPVLRLPLWPTRYKVGSRGRLLGSKIVCDPCLKRATKNQSNPNRDKKSIGTGGTFPIVNHPYAFNTQ